MIKKTQTNKKTCLKPLPHFIILSFKTHFHCFCCEDKLSTLKKEDKSPKLKYSSEKQIISHSLHTCNALQLKSTQLTAGMLVLHSSGPVKKMSWKHLFGHFKVILFCQSLENFLFPEQFSQ